jgi:hypothetical protein
MRQARARRNRPASPRQLEAGDAALCIVAQHVARHRHAVTAIEWPDDELKIYATLHGPFLALTDEAVFSFRQYVAADGSLEVRRLNPTRSVDRDALPSLPKISSGLLTAERESPRHVRHVTHAPTRAAHRSKRLTDR